MVLSVLKRYGHTGLPVHFVGKAATFNLLYAFPLLLLGDGESTFAQWALPIGWAFAWWGDRCTGWRPDHVHHPGLAGGCPGSRGLRGGVMAPSTSEPPPAAHDA